MDEKTEKETIVETATYKGHILRATSRNRILVEVGANHYPAKDLQEAKKMIDDLEKTKKN